MVIKIQSLSPTLKQTGLFLAASYRHFRDKETLVATEEMLVQG